MSEAELAGRATRYARARAEYEQERLNLQAAVRDAVKAGMPEAEAARRAGVTRMTVRAWIGK